MTCQRTLFALLDVLCPMHVVLNTSGHVSHAGPTAVKIAGDRPLVGERFLELFELLRPRAVTSMAQLLQVAGVKLHLRTREPTQSGIKGVLVPLPDGGGAVVNLSFGISILDAVRDYALTSADFAATDLTIEMLYLVEAKSAAMAASRKLNQRLQGAMIAAEEQAFTDTLTGLKNRRALDHILPRLVQERRAFGLMHLDLDFFKAVNDTMGHPAGDHVLQRVARVLVESSRDDDCVARVGGDEFVLVFRGITDDETLGRIAQRIISEVEKPIAFQEQTCKVSASVGIAVFPGDVEATVDQLMADADRALYASKHKGRATYTIFAPCPRQKDSPDVL
ncbi:diguanylate cyclase (GGDEF) domain-containing protein [Shimia aestuarii]|uniref:Diguanylate cyclase (GGDEF) domain-containing protein n=1 Tax=Shimia aestuarii TaxID=254406 RepID=A0A1I4QXC6_9RHOB|nr:GGDEF domain-containing protein [Shimia aestuarii]SFM44657.1 diguanylate cyclase (GGDEF) domain-containing protein [Shimia aestuarii]